MAAKREATCPLCGARMTAAEVLDASGNLITPELGVIDACCPYCQGYFEVRPTDGRIDIGYLRDGKNAAFEVAVSLACEGLIVQLQGSSPRLRLTAPGHLWEFGP